MKDYFFIKIIFFKFWGFNIYWFKVSPSFIGGVNEKLTLQLLNVLKFKNEYDISLANPFQIIFNIPHFASSQTIDSSNQGASYMFIFVMLFSLLVSLITGGSIELMWSLTNALQIMYFWETFNLYFPSNLITVFTYMKYSNFDNPVSEYLRGKMMAIFESVKG